MTECNYKICILGDNKIDKTIFINKLAYDDLSEQSKLIIGIDFDSAKKTIGENIFKLQLWDLAGQTKFNFMLDTYLSGSNGIFVMINPTITDTINSAIRLKHILDTKIKCPVILLINKIDADTDIINYKEYGFDKFIEISTKTGDGIESACEMMLDLISLSKNF